MCNFSCRVIHQGKVISKKNAQHIFNPLFGDYSDVSVLSKMENETGIGLNLCWSIV
jgi:hypothetical protein